MVLIKPMVSQNVCQISRVVAFINDVLLSLIDSECFVLALKAIKSLDLAISSNIFAKSGNQDEDSLATRKAGPIERAKKRLSLDFIKICFENDCN